MSLKAQLASDLHLDFHQDEGSSFFKKLPVAADILILAGDVAQLNHPYDTLHYWFERLCAGRRAVYYVKGNHEYYGSTPAETDAVSSKLEKDFPVLKVLKPGRVEELDGHRILGSTLWFREDPLAAMIASRFTDFRHIKQFNPWVYEENKRTIEFFEKELRAGDIVVTHHLPARRSIAPEFENSYLNTFFLCDIEGLLREKKPALVCHGHGHNFTQYQLEATQVVCNPLGYVHLSEETEFRPSFCVQV